MGRKTELLVLGSGCAKCTELYALTAESVRQLNLCCDLRKVTNLREMVELGVMVTPALVVDGSLKIAGRVPGKEELLGILRAACASC